MARRAVLLVFALLALLSMLAAVAYVNRLSLAQTALLQHLETLGVPGAALTVTEIEADRVSLSDLSAGEAREIAAESVVVRYSLDELLRGRAERVEINGLSARLDLGEGAAPLGSLQPFIDELVRAESAPGAAGEAGPPVPLPQVWLSDARIEATTPLGVAALTLDGTLQEAEGGALDLDLDIGATSPLGNLTGRLMASGGPDTGLAGTFSLTGEALAAPQGEFRAAAVEGEVGFEIDEAGWPVRGDADLLFTGLSLAETEFDAAQLNLGMTAEGAELAGVLRADDGSVRIEVDGRAADLQGRPSVAFELKSEVTADAPLRALTAGIWPETGRARLNAVVDGDLPQLVAPPQSPEEVLAWLFGGAFQGEIDAELEGLSFGEAGPGLSAAARASATWSGRALIVELEEDGRLSATGITGQVLAALGLPFALADQVAAVSGGSLSVTLPADAPSPFKASLEDGDQRRSVSLAGTADLEAGPLAATLSGRWLGEVSDTVITDRLVIEGFNLAGRDFALDGYEFEEIAVEGAFDGGPEDFRAVAEVRASLLRPTVGETSAERVDLTLPVRVTRQGETATVTLTRPGSLVAEGLRVADQLSAEGPLQATIPEHDATLRLEPAVAFEHRTVLSLAETGLKVAREGEAPFALLTRAPRIVVTGGGDAEGLYEGRAEIADASLRLPDYDLALDGLSAEVALTPGLEDATARFEVAALSHEATPPAFAPVRVTGEARHHAARLEVSALAHGPAGDTLAKVSGHYDVADGTGELEAALEPLVFAPGGLQPGQLLPLLARLEEASGRVEGTTHVTWDGESLSGTADLALDGLAFRTPEAAVEGLDLRLHLDKVDPPSSPPGQTLSIAALDPGVPVENFSTTFSLPPGPLGRVLIEGGGFALGGTRFTVGESLFDIAAPENRLELRVGALDLAALFEAAAVDGLSGDGRLSGAIPVVVRGDTVAVENARLSSSAPGSVKFRSEAAIRALASQGPQVELMLKALENFQYETLTVTVDMDSGYQTGLLIEMLGRNPDLMDGRPFQFNINLGANLAPFLEALSLGREVASDLLRRSWKLGP
jgi:hypothetical protein